MTTTANMTTGVLMVIAKWIFFGGRTQSSNLLLLPSIHTSILANVDDAEDDDNANGMDGNDDDDDEEAPFLLKYCAVSNRTGQALLVPVTASQTRK